MAFRPGTAALEHNGDRARDDAQIEPRALVVDVVGVVRETFRPRVRGHDVRKEGLRGLKVVVVTMNANLGESLCLRLGHDAGAYSDIEADFVINCAGLHCDRVARSAGLRPDSRIIPFRGDYWKLASAGSHLVRHLIYPVPDPTLPFLGVHFTRMIGGGIEAGPNAVLAFKREGYRRTDISLRDSWETFTFPGLYLFLKKYPGTTWSELRNSFSKKVFLKNLQRLIPEIRMEHISREGGSGVRAQAIHHDGSLLMDFALEQKPGQIHLLNAPSPGATASLAIATHLLAQIPKAATDKQPVADS